MGAGPIRSCTGCRTKLQQPDLIRIVAVPGGAVAVDPLGRRPAGRGAYVCADRACVELALSSGGLRRALRYQGSLPEGLRDELLGRAEMKEGKEPSDR
jgi:uncharacterized protein